MARADGIIMPLKAIANNKTITGPDLSDREWTDLKLRHGNGLPVTMACCGAPGHLRVSKNGTRHFYHAVDAGCRFEPESAEHLEIKEQIYRVCKTEGWETSVEYPAPDRAWISDVYATRDGRKIVFEIQISAISPDELESRDRKYRDEGIESYWLLDNFLGKTGIFASWYNAHLFGGDKQAGEDIPYIDPSLFETGPENHIFFAKGIRCAGLHAKKQVLFTTNNREIPLAVWVREVLKGNYRRYLDDTAAMFHRKRRLMTMAAPALIRFREFYRVIVRDAAYRKKAGRCGWIAGSGAISPEERSRQKKVSALLAEIDWLENEYRSCSAESSGLFIWKKIPGVDSPRPFFRLESESGIRKLEEYIRVFDRWERSFNNAISSREREFPAEKRR